MPASEQQSLFPNPTAPQSGTSTTTAPKPRKSSPPEKEPVLVSLCFLGVTCRWHGRRAKRRDTLLTKLKEKYVTHLQIATHRGKLLIFFLHDGLLEWAIVPIGMTGDHLSTFQQFMGRRPLSPSQYPAFA